MSRKILALSVEVVFDGDYYDADELVTVSDMWIRGAFDDRDDVVFHSLTVIGKVTEDNDG